MKRVIMVIGAGSAAITALGRKMAETVGEIRDLAEIGPRSIDSLQHDASVEEMQLMQYEAQRDEPESCPACERSIQFAVAQSDRIRDILGDRNDNSRTVVDLIDELCEELDRRDPSVTCGWCGAENGKNRADCCHCGRNLKAPEPADFIGDIRGPKFTTRENRVPCGLCNGVGVVDIGFGKSDTCGGCKGTGRVEK